VVTSLAPPTLYCMRQSWSSPPQPCSAWMVPCLFAAGRVHPCPSVFAGGHSNRQRYDAQLRCTYFYTAVMDWCRLLCVWSLCRNPAHSAQRTSHMLCCCCRMCAVARWARGTRSLSSTTCTLTRRAATLAPLCALQSFGSGPKVQHCGCIHWCCNRCMFSDSTRAE
jgi:hypothetical protein